MAQIPLHLLARADGDDLRDDPRKKRNNGESKSGDDENEERKP